MRQGEDFGGVCKRDRTLSGRVKHVVDVDEERNKPQVCFITFWNEEAHTRSKQRPGHIREGRQK